MAVMQNSIIFGGIDSADFGIYIGGEGVFNAPKRAVEMVTVPGRNGDIAIDQGHYENIEVTYSAFNYEEDLATFAQRLSDFRNALASQIGYQQLSDTYHPNEYRMALFVGGLKIDPIKYNTASTFEIKFDCKPQRWLANGASPIAITDGQTLSNPTQYDSNPLIQFEGYGSMSVGEHEIKVENLPIGEVLIGKAKQIKSPADTQSGSGTQELTTNASLLEAGDWITMSDKRLTVTLTSAAPRHIAWYIRSMSITSTSNCVASTAISGKTYISGHLVTGAMGTITVILDDMNWTKGSSALATKTATVNFSFTQNNGQVFTNVLTITTAYDNDTETITHSWTLENLNNAIYTVTTNAPQIIGDSTQMVTDETYIDASVGSAYFYAPDGTMLSRDSAVTLGAKLPALAPGANEITYENTLTDVKITPRWWKL